MRKHILYLASGSSRRFGKNKLLYPVKGKPMYLWTLEMLENLVKKREDCCLLVVSRYEAIRQEASQRGITAVDSSESERGISFSIRAGLSALKNVEEEDFLLFVVADQPYLTEDSMLRLLDCAKEGVEGASLCWGNRPGNPTLFAAKLLPELMALEGDTGGRAVLRRHQCIYVQAASERELEDIDTPLGLTTEDSHG
ncbi:molybdopterin binding protein [Clostridium sp. CAG:1013]|nr:molybdopterin binding protein [Clostridium sp. CAG:1013]